MPVSTTGRRAVVVDVPTLTERQRDSMFRLLQRYFSGVERAVFEKDLGEKQWAVLLLAGDGSVVGFTTLMTWRERSPKDFGCDGLDGSEEVLILFSGDTIVDRAHWGELALWRAWGSLAERAVEESGLPAYWFLLCSGYKTYRFLTTFFSRFYPRRDPPVGHAGGEARLLDLVATRRFDGRWDREAGIVRLGDGVALRRGVADIGERELADPDIAFFVRANPGHDAGDELACIARFDHGNFTRAAQWLRAPQVAARADAASERGEV